MGNYIPSTQKEIEEMLEEIGVLSSDELYDSVPSEMQVDKLDIPDGMSEMQVSEYLKNLSCKNKVFSSTFRGAGAYKHYIPSIVKSVISKEEFITAYTPYQAEMSQGVLQSIFEYQTMISELCGMDASNASVYDGAVAAAEAVAMCRDRKRTKVLISSTANPMTIRTIETYCAAAGVIVETISSSDGVTDISAVANMLDDTVSCVYIDQPNYFGYIEPAKEIGEIAHDSGARYIIGANPISLGILKTPREYGADIAVGEGQPLGIPLSFGGPYLGFMATTKEMQRKLPGRIVGQTVDVNGKRAFLLTLQAREQHIRREKATSNICTNQALCALTSAVYLSTLGPYGLRDVATLCMSNAHYLKDKLCEIDGFCERHSREFFHEFVTSCPIDADVLNEELAKREILGGLSVDEGILWCATEMCTKERIDELISAIKEVCAL